MPELQEIPASPEKIPISRGQARALSQALQHHMNPHISVIERDARTIMLPLFDQGNITPQEELDPNTPASADQILLTGRGQLGKMASFFAALEFDSDPALKPVSPGSSLYVFPFAEHPEEPAPIQPSSFTGEKRTQLASALANEINTNINIFVGSAQLALSENPEDAQKEAAESMLKNARAVAAQVAILANSPEINVEINKEGQAVIKELLLDQQPTP